MVIVMANHSLCASSSSNTAQWYADSGQLSNAIVTKLCSVCVYVCLRLCGCGRHSKWAWLSPTCEARPNILSACELCTEWVCVCARVCVGAMPKRFHCSTQRRVAASCLVLTTCCCESCCVPSSVLCARNASLDFGLLSL